jgi:hypothetical protein
LFENRSNAIKYHQMQRSFADVSLLLTPITLEGRS